MNKVGVVGAGAGALVDSAWTERRRDAVVENGDNAGEMEGFMPARTCSALGASVRPRLRTKESAQTVFLGFIWGLGVFWSFFLLVFDGVWRSKEVLWGAVQAKRVGRLA